MPDHRALAAALSRQGPRVSIGDVRFEQVAVTHTDLVTHLTYRIVR